MVNGTKSIDFKLYKDIFSDYGRESQFYTQIFTSDEDFFPFFFFNSVNFFSLENVQIHQYIHSFKNEINQKEEFVKLGPFNVSKNVQKMHLK